MCSGIKFLVVLSLVAVQCSAFVFSKYGSRSFCQSNNLKLMAGDDIKYDAQGYIIKSQGSDWFNGLSVDPGNSLDDPRAVPPVCKEFAEGVKGGTLSPSFKETMEFIDANYNYFEVPFTNGDLKSGPNENVGSSKIFSFALMTGMNEAATLKLFGEIYSNLDPNPNGTDHPNIRTFISKGWKGVSFARGLSIASKLSAYDDTDSAMATQSVNEGENEWDTDSDSWIP